MNTLRTAICDDNEEERQRLLDVLEHLGEPPARLFCSGEDLLEAFRPGMYDLVFLDIYMPGLDGVEVAARIRARDPQIPIAFLTTSLDHALDGYRLHVDRYIVKPFGADEVAEALGMARRARDSTPHLTLRPGGRQISVPHARIACIEQQNHTSVFHLDDGSGIKVTGKLDDFESVLPTPPFFRSHKSYLVNLDHVRWLDRELSVFEMEDGTSAHIRRGTLRAASEAFERRLFDQARMP